MILTETWLTKEKMDGELHLPHYCLIRAERESNLSATAHGDVLIAIHKDLKYSPVTLPTELQVSCAAAAFIELHKKQLVLLAYTTHLIKVRTVYL